MAIQGSGAYSNANYVSQDLRLAAPIIKRNYTTAISVGGAAGQVVGHVRGLWLRLPASYAGSARPALLGFDNGATGSFNSTNDNVLRIPHDSFSTTAIRRRLQLGYSNAAGGQVYAGTEGDIGSISQFGLTVNTLILDGVINIGSNASPVWRNFVAVCPSGSTPETYVAGTASLAAWLSGTTGRLFHQLFVAQGTSNARTNPGLAIEHAALITGDFPWDTVNNRPHHDAIRALAASGGNPFLTWQGLVDGMNAGNLPYANLRSNGDAVDPRPGRCSLDYWWKLDTLSAGLVNSGSAGTATLAITTGTSTGFDLENAAGIAPSHWSGGAPSINTPLDRFTGGRGLEPIVRTGTYDAGVTTALRGRLLYGAGAVNVDAVEGAVVPGFDWSTAGIVMNAGAFTCTRLAPEGGPYTLHIDDANNPARVAVPLADNIVGTAWEIDGQSGAALALLTGAANQPLGPNNLNIAVAANALGQVFRLNNIDANGSGAYIKPTPVAAVLRQGTTPNVGHGFVALLNQWNVHNPRRPIAIYVIAINGTTMDQWSSNSLVLGSASWRFLGSKVAPGDADAASSGVVGYHALIRGSKIDGRFMMWTGIAETPANRAVWTAAVDALFDQSPNAPYLVAPPWRGHRDLPDGAATTKTRADSVDYVLELGSRGALAPYWPDIVGDNSGSLHSANAASPGGPNSSGPVSDANSVGQGKLGRCIGQSIAWFYDRRIKGGGVYITGAWFVDGARTQIRVEFERALRTLNGAAIANRFSISTDNGVTWPLAGVGFTAALNPGGRSATLTINSGSWAATNVRVDYCREWPFPPSEVPSEADVETALYGLLYDAQTHRGNTNLASPAGNPLCSSNRIGAGVAGMAVRVKSAAELVATGKLAGSRSVEIEMVLDGTSVLATKTLPITATAG